MLKPLRDYVILEKVTSEEKTMSGIVLPQTVKEEKNIGIVVAVGAGKILNNGQLVEPVVANGDKVLYSKYGATDVEFENKKYIILREEEILAIF